MITMWMMEVAANAVVDVVGVRNRLVAAAGTVDMTGFVSAAAMVRSAAVGVLPGDVDHVLVDMILMRVVEVTIVQIIDVAVVANGGVAASRPMLVSMVRMSRCAAGGHWVSSFPCSGSADAAVSYSTEWSIALRTNAKTRSS